MGLANDGVAFPVPDAASLINNGWAFFYAGPVLQHPPALASAGVTLASYFLAAQMTHQITPQALVLIDVLVDALGADVQGFLYPQASSCLFGRELTTQVVADMFPFILAKLAGIAPLALTSSGLVVGLRRLVALGRRIAFEFARDA